MSDKVQKIRQEIERLYNLYELANDYQRMGACSTILSFIDSLPEEPASKDLENQYKSNMRCQHAYTQDDLMKTKSEDLEEELRKILNKHYYFSDEDDELRSTPELAKYIAHHFAEWQKQQMMKDAVLETKVIMDCDGDGIETPYEEWLTLEDTEIPYIPDNLGLKEGDKVKIIILKTE